MPTIAERSMTHSSQWHSSQKMRTRLLSESWLEHVRHGLEAADRLHRFLQLPHRALVAVLVG